MTLEKTDASENISDNYWAKQLHQPVHPRTGGFQELLGGLGIKIIRHH